MDLDDPASSSLNITGPDYECENYQSSQTLTGMSSQSSVPESHQSLHLHLGDDDSEFDPS